MTYVETKGTAKDSKDFCLTAECLNAGKSLTAYTTKSAFVVLQTVGIGRCP